MGFALLLVGRLQAQQPVADSAWSRGEFDVARAAYTRELKSNPRSVRANLRLGILLSWDGKLDSALVLLGRARGSAPADQDVQLAQAQVMAWNKQYADALARYDSLLLVQPALREALLGRARALAWAGRLDEAEAAYRQMLAKDSTDRDALLGSAQVSAWKGDLATAERDYQTLLRRNSRDAEARVGLGYVYFWQGREAAAGRQAGYALAVDSTNKSARELRRVVRSNTRPAVEASANWSNDSDRNTSFWQTLSGSTALGGGIGLFGSVNALETRDPVRDATRIGGEAGLTLSAGHLLLTGAGGARRLSPEITPARTVATYRGQLRYRPAATFGLGASYSRVPFDEIASLIERELDMELLEAGFDARPVSGLTVYGGGGELWLSDGNRRWSVSAGLTQKILRHFFVGAFGRTLAFDHPGLGYFSPGRFSVLEGVAGYSLERAAWSASLSGGLGAQQVGKDGAAQSEWHLEGRLGKRWGVGNRIELFGLITNSAVSSTTGAFRYRSAGISTRLTL